MYIIVDDKICPICGRRFSQKCKVVYHVRVKHGMKALERLAYEILVLLRSNGYLSTYQIIKAIREKYPEFNKMKARERNQIIYAKLRQLYVKNLITHKDIGILLWRVKTC